MHLHPEHSEKHAVGDEAIPTRDRRSNRPTAAPANSLRARGSVGFLGMVLAGDQPPSSTQSGSRAPTESPGARRVYSRYTHSWNCLESQEIGRVGVCRKPIP